MAKSSTSFKKGQGGRTKGSKNRYTRIKEDILAVWDEIGGKERLIKYAKANDLKFFKFVELIAHLLPKEFEHTLKDYLYPELEDIPTPILKRLRGLSGSTGNPGAL